MALLAAVLAPGGDAFAQGRPRRVDPSQTVPSAPRKAQTTQDPAETVPDGADDEPLQLEGSLIEVPVVVSDRTGHYVPRLRQQDFRLLEDGKQQQISFFSTERVPIHVALVIDTSGSTQATLPQIQEAAISFIGQLMPQDEVAVVSFASEVIVEQDFTSDRRALAQAVRRTQSLGATRLYDAVYLTVTQLLQQKDGRKALIILSDGQDQHSKEVTFNEAVNVCSETDVAVYGIRYPESGPNVFQRGGRPSGGPFPGNGNPGNYPPTQPRRRSGGGISIPGLPRIPGINWPLTAEGSAGTYLAQPQWGGRQQWPGGSMNKDPFMEEITSNSGGTLFYAGAVGDVDRLFNTIAEELRSVYMIGYSTSNPISNGGYRRIRVEVPGKPDLAVRHRLGYNADSYKEGRR